VSDHPEVHRKGGEAFARKVAEGEDGPLLSDPKPRPVGRPKSIPDGARPRAIRLTDTEFAAVEKLVRRMRGTRNPTPEADSSGGGE
jgi:hypothetical protein